jgi:hypothetical protein
VESAGALEARESELVESDLTAVVSTPSEAEGLVGELPSASSASGTDPQAARVIRAASASAINVWIGRSIS